MVVAILTGAWVWSARPHLQSTASPSAATAARPSPVSAVTGTAAGPYAGGAPSSAPAGAGAVVVDVAGKVRRPGLVRLSGGARAFDAVAAAGGALPGVSLDSINLAARVTDGQQIVVGPGPPVSSGGARPSSSGGPATPVDLNSAGMDQLQTLPGVGPVLAQHILDWRAAHGRFASIDQLRQVTGIGPAKFESLKPLVTV